MSRYERMTRNGAITVVQAECRQACVGGSPSRKAAAGKEWWDGRGTPFYRVMGRKERTKRTVLPHPLPSAG